MSRLSLIRGVMVVSAAMLLAVSAASAAGPYPFYPVTPCRIVDTRRAPGPTGGPSLVSLGTRSFPIVGGTCGVPATAKAVTVNVTIVNPTNSGYLIVYPYNIAQPLVSTINWDIGESALANGAIVPLTTDPSFNLSIFAELYTGGTVHAILDVTGYFQ